MDSELIKHIELLIGSIGVIMGLFFGCFLLINRRAQPKANTFLAIYLLAFSLRIGKSLFHNYVEIDPSIRTLFLTLLLCIGPCIWLYSLYLHSPNRSSVKTDYLHFVPFVILMLTSWMIPNDGSAIFGYFYNVLIIHMAAYVLGTLFWLNYRSSLPDNQIKAWLYAFLLINLGFIIIYALISFMIIPYYLGFSFLFSLLIISFSFWALRNPYLFKVPHEKYKNSTIDEEQASELMTDLTVYMDRQKPYLRPALTLAELSQELDVSAKQLSQVINQSESVNFSQFVARYRIDEAKRLLRSESHQHFKISAIAFDSGFSSISSFNEMFKKQTGQTASAYRKSQI